MCALENENFSLIEKMRKKFYDMFSTYDVHSIKQSLQKLPLRQRNTVILFYGLDGKHCYDCRQIAQKYNMMVKYTVKTLEEGIKNLTRLLEGTEIVEENKNDINKYLLKRYLIDNDYDAYLGLIDENMWLVYAFTDKYRDSEYYEELISSANFALLKAIDYFDVNRLNESDFTVYAATFIRNEIHFEFKLKEKNKKILLLDDIFMDEEMIVDNVFSEDDCIDVLSKKEDDTLKKIRVYDALNSLDKRDRMIVEYLYGFKDGNKHSQEEIVKLTGLSSSTVSSIVKRSLNKLSRLLEDYEQEYVLPGEINKDIKDKNKIFYDMFRHKEREKVLSLLHKFKNNSFVVLYYGLNGKDLLDYGEIANKFNVSEEYVVSKIESILDKMKKIYKLDIVEDQKIADNRYILLVGEFGEFAVKEVIGTLDRKDALFIKLFYGIGRKKFSINDMVKRYGITRQACYQKSNRIIANVERKLNEKYSSLNERFYGLFEGFSNEEVDKAFACLYEDEKEILSLAYGFKCIRVTYDKIAQKYGCSRATVSYKLKKIIEKMNKLIENSTFEEDKRYKFYSKFEGYTREQINCAYKKLDRTSQDVLSLYFGLYGRAVSCKKIAEDYNVSVQNLWNIVYRSISLMKKLLENPEIEISNSRGRQRKTK